MIWCRCQVHCAQSLLSTEQGEDSLHASWPLRGSPDDLKIASMHVSSCYETSRVVSTLVPSPQLSHSHCLLSAHCLQLSLMHKEAMSLTCTVMR